MDLTELFKQLNLSDLTKKTFFTLFEKGPLSAKQLSVLLDIPRPSVYDHVKTLIEKGLILERTEDNKKVFHIEDPRHFKKIIDDAKRENGLNKGFIHKSGSNCIT